MTPTFITFDIAGISLQPFSPGDQVELKSGGLPMTVLDACAECGDVTVAYCDSDGDIDVLTLPAAALQHYVEDDE